MPNVIGGLPVGWIRLSNETDATIFTTNDNKISISIHYQADNGDVAHIPAKMDREIVEHLVKILKSALKATNG